MFRLYVRLCKRYGPEGFTLSAYAWKSRSRWVRVIDAGFVLFKGQYHHCEQQHLRETASN